MRVRVVVACRDWQLVSLGCLARGGVDFVVVMAARVFIIFTMPIITRLQILQQCVNLSQINIDYSSINETVVQVETRENPRLSLTVLA
ncbi:MAG: hypothetical protein P8Y83_02145 [Gammaproteobacteria bacterium]|jgi:hypothetical protein